MTDTIVNYKAIDFSAHFHSDMDGRNADWCRLYQDGKTSQDIANLYGVTRERVCQILRRANLIEHKMQRRRLAAELLEQDKAEVKANRKREEDQILEYVRAGDSTATAAAKVGLSTMIAQWICKKNGVKSSWGRWRDLSARKERLTELVEAGASLNAAMLQAGGEEGRKICYLWVKHNCPELLKKNRPRAAPLDDPPVPRIIIPRIATKDVAFAQLEWSQDRVSKLLDLWFKGSSAQQIADIFGDCTRNAIIGQVHRLRVAGKLRSPA